MRYNSYFFISILLMLSLNNCGREIKPIKIKFYTFGNGIQYNKKYPVDIQNIVQPYDDYFFSQINFEDKVNGWKGNINMFEFSQLNPGFNVSSNINASKNLLKRYFNSSDNRKNPKNSHVLYKNANVNLKSSNIPEFINSLKRNNTNAVLVYTEDDNVSGRNTYHEEESLRNAILSNYKNKKQIIIIYKPSIVHLSNNKPKPAPPKDKPIGNNKEPLKETAPPKEPELKYPTILSKTVALEAKKSTISWRNIKLKTEKNTVTNYKIDYFLYGENQPMFTTITTDTKTNYESCDKCNKLPEGYVITINVSLQTTPNSYTTIAACDLAPTNKSLTNCHCPLYIINK